MAQKKIPEVAISPPWAVTVLQIDAAAHLVLRIEHPRYGELNFLLPIDESMKLAAAIAKISEKRDEAQISGTRNTTPPRSQAHD